MSATPLDTLVSDLQQLDLRYKGTYASPEAILALEKTIKSHNITITDWNTFVERIKDLGSVIDALYECIPDIKNVLDDVYATHYTKDEMDQALTDKLDKQNGIIVGEFADEDADDYEVGQMLFDTESRKFLRVVEVESEKVFIEYSNVIYINGNNSPITDSDKELLSNNNNVILVVANENNKIYRLNKTDNSEEDVIVAEFVSSELYKSTADNKISIYHEIYKLDTSVDNNFHKDYKLISTLPLVDYVDAVDNKKLDKVTTADGYKEVYYKQPDGSQGMAGFGTNPTGSFIVQRDSNGQIQVPNTPTINKHATSKEYVDDAISDALSTTYKPKGSISVADFNDLTITASMNGWVYNITDSGTITIGTQGDLLVNAGDNVAIIYDSEHSSYTIDKLSGIVNLSDYYNKGETDTLLNAKEDVANKVTSFNENALSDTKYPSEKAVYDLVKKTGLPYFETGPFSNILTFLTTNNLVDKPFIIHLTPGNYFIGRFLNAYSSNYVFEFESLISEERYTSGAGTPVDLTDKTFSDIFSSTYRADYALKSYVDSQDALNEKLANKKTTLTDSDDDFPTTRAVKTECNNIRAIIAGKDTSYILSCAETIASVKEDINLSWHSYYNVYLVDMDKRTATDITAEIKAGTYNNVNVINSIFNSTDDYITIPKPAGYNADPLNDNYLILRNTASSYLLVRIFYTGNIDYFKRGSNFFVIETNVPDRWSDGGERCYALETTKVDLTNYATKDQAFNVINATDIVSNTLIQAQYDLITNGKPTLISGTLLNRSNIFILGLAPYSGSYWGTCVCQNSYHGEIRTIQIDSSKVISFTSQKYTNLPSVEQINGKGIDYYRNNVYPYATNTSTELKYETVNNIEVNANTTFTLQSAPSGTYPEYKANITNIDTSNSKTITLTGVAHIKTNDDNIVIVEGTNSTFTIPADTTLELNIQNGNAIVYNWGI